MTRLAYQGGVLALDINSISTGVAFGQADSPSPKCATWKLPGCSTEDDLNRSLCALHDSVAQLGGLIHPAWVAIEAPFISFKGDSNAQTAMALISLVAVARAAGTKAGARISLVAVQSWRKHFCGSGRPEDPKGATKARCRLFGWAVENDDEADSCGVWAYEMSRRFPKWSPQSTPLFGRKSA